MEKKIGIWLDLKQAHVITLVNDISAVQIIQSELEDFHVGGGARSKTPWGPVDAVSESTLLERRKHQLKNYFNKIIVEIKNCDAVLLFGPADTKKKLQEAIEGQRLFNIKVLDIKNADSMSENQKVASVRNYFSGKGVTHFQ